MHVTNSAEKEKCEKKLRKVLSARLAKSRKMPRKNALRAKNFTANVGDSLVKPVAPKLNKHLKKNWTLLVSITIFWRKKKSICAKNKQFYLRVSH